MDKKPQIQDPHYDALVKQISELVALSKQKAMHAVNSALVEMNWNIGKYIVEFEQNGNARAEYGAKLIPQLSRDLTLLLGNGYSKSNLANMRLLYLRFPIFQTVSGKLSWSHYIELIGIDSDVERNFYFIESMNQNWSVRELRTQRDRGLFYQLATSKEAGDILSLSNNGLQITQPKDVVKDTYFFEA